MLADDLPRRPASSGDIVIFEFKVRRVAVLALGAMLLFLYHVTKDPSSISGRYFLLKEQPYRDILLTMLGVMAFVGVGMLGRILFLDKRAVYIRGHQICCAWLIGAQKVGFDQITSFSAIRTGLGMVFVHRTKGWAILLGPWLMGTTADNLLAALEKERARLKNSTHS